MKNPFTFLRALLKRARPKINPPARVLSCLKPVVALGAAFLASSGVALAQTSNAAEAPVTWWQAIILGLVQGLTEFIPVSSSAHLNITHALFGHPRELAYDVLLSVGTTAAVAWYYRHDWKGLLFDPAQKRLRNLIFISCIPAVLFAPIIHPFEEKAPLSLATFNAAMLAIAGFFLLIADKKSPQTRDISEVTTKDSWLIGIGQALALIPGVSRSGATITAGRWLGFNRADAARFSFLMSLPINLGAVIYKIKDFGDINASPSAMVLGIVASAISGFWAIGFLLNYLKTRDVTPFFVWRLVVAALVFGLAAVHIL